MGVAHRSVAGGRGGDRGGRLKREGEHSVTALRSCSSRTPPLRLRFSASGIRELPAARERRQLLEPVEAEFGLVGRAHRIPQIARGGCSHVQRLVAAPPALQLPNEPNPASNHGPQLTRLDPPARSPHHRQCQFHIAFTWTPDGPIAPHPADPPRRMHINQLSETPENQRPGPYTQPLPIDPSSQAPHWKPEKRSLPIASRAQTTHTLKRE